MFAEVNPETLCNLTNIQSNRHLIRSCSSVRNSGSSLCLVQCRKNYVLHGSSTSNCQNGTFSPVQCSLEEDLVQECEKTNFVRSYLRLTVKVIVFGFTV